jgi:uncharacterized protein YcbX
MGKITRLNVFPVKGMQPATRNHGDEIYDMQLTKTGLSYAGVHDRALLVAAESPKGGLTFVSPRGWADDRGPRVAHPNDARLAGVSTDILRGGEVTLAKQDIGSIAVSPADPAYRRSKSQPVAIRGGRAWAFEISPEHNEFVSEVIGRAARLMLVDPTELRQTRSGDFRKVLGPDSRALLIANQASLNVLNAERPDPSMPPIPISRYRANIVVDGLSWEGGLTQPFAEDQASKLAIAGVAVTVMNASQRCRFTNVDERGEYVGGGLAVLQPRRGVQQDMFVGSTIPDSKGVYFGVNAEPDMAMGEEYYLVVGDPVTVAEWAPYPNFAKV